MSGPLDRAAIILESKVPGRVKRNLPLAPLTTFRLGGPASIYMEPEADADLVAAAAAVSETGIPYLV
ncbi:MAG: hypothetical protein QOE25_740, partial [Actinomycetota bacterium]|nr:hypothetical protein [Actinomycetota bacterium]